MMKSAPMGLVFVADLSRMNSPFLRSMEAKRFSAWVDTGYIVKMFTCIVLLQT